MMTSCAMNNYPARRHRHRWFDVRGIVYPHIKEGRDFLKQQQQHSTLPDGIHLHPRVVIALLVAILVSATLPVVEGQVEFMCGKNTRDSDQPVYPLAMTSNQCSTSNPTNYYTYGSTVNHVARRVYYGSMYSGSVFGYPIPGEGYGNLEMMAGKRPCTTETDCMRNPSTVGAFSNTILGAAPEVHSDYNLHPSYYVPDITYLIVLDVNTHLSSRFMGTGTATTDYTQLNNVYRTSAPIPQATNDIGSNDDALFLISHGNFLARLSLSTGMVTVPLCFVWRSEALEFYSILHVRGWLYVAPVLKHCVLRVAVVGGVSTFDAYEYCTNSPMIHVPTTTYSLWHFAVSDNKASIILSARDT
eukprot:PhM_4_TR16813/c0_g1_i7/m.104689